MARPTKHYGKWRIRWVDENGERKSEVFDDRREASFQLQQRELEAEERRRGLKPAPSTPKMFSDVADYWEKHRIPQKRSGHHDQSVLRRHLRPAFGGVTLGDAPERDPIVRTSLATLPCARHKLAGHARRSTTPATWAKRPGA